MSSASGHEVPAGAEAAAARRRRPELTPEEARNWRLAKLFDLRSFIGALMLIFGILVIIPGFVASTATIDKADGINLELWIGGIMLVLAAFFLTWVILKPPPPVTTAEAEAARKAREEFGTQGPAGHGAVRASRPRCLRDVSPCGRSAARRPVRPESAAERTSGP